MDAGEVQEKVKEVICKTITNIPLSEATSKERLSDAVSVTIYISINLTCILHFIIIKLVCSSSMYMQLNIIWANLTLKQF